MYPSQNLFEKDDDDCGGNQFQLVDFLLAFAEYILVVTTYYSNKQGTFLSLHVVQGTLVLMVNSDNNARIHSIPRC